MRRFAALLGFAIVCAAGADAGAIGFGRIASSVTLGQPLDLAVPVRLEPGETLDAACVQAEVHFGDTRISDVAVRLEGAADAEQRIVRVRTASTVVEPVVTVDVGLGCGARMARRIVAFADPPEIVAALPPVAAPEPAPTRPPATVALAPAPAVRAAPAAAASTPRRVVTPRRPPRATAQAAAPRTWSPATRPRTAQPQPQPRLKLEAEDFAATQAALDAAREQVTAARAAASAAQAAASAVEARLASYDAELAKLQAQAKADREAAVELRARLVQAEASSRWVPWLGALAALLAIVGAGLAWRLRRQTRRPWWDPQEIADAVPQPSARAPLDEPPVRTTTTPSAHGEALEPLALPRPALADTDAQPLAATVTPGAPRHRPDTEWPAPVGDMSVDEQIDLEQQADFFIALGQEESAIDLLLGHLRSTGGTSPMPYLKLLDIHRRRGERDGYERMRERFNQRFNAVAPGWGGDPSAGRSLDGYPEVIARLQRVWWSPLDAMAELEALLFKRGEGAELFDLPAYHEVLFLYQLARDLHLHPEDARRAPGDTVDVLLPIGEAQESGAVSVRHLDLESTSVLHPAPPADEPLDLDLELPSDSKRAAFDDATRAIGKR